MNGLVRRWRSEGHTHAGDGGWVITGTATVSSAQRLWWRRVGPTGDVLAEQTYAHPGGNVQAGKVRPAVDMGDGMALGGTGTAFGATHLVLVRTDAWGHSRCSAAGNCATESL